VLLHEPLPEQVEPLLQRHRWCRSKVCYRRVATDRASGDEVVGLGGAQTRVTEVVLGVYHRGTRGAKDGCGVSTGMLGYPAAHTASCHTTRLQDAGVQNPGPPR
jgi:hypothetical protein